MALNPLSLEIIKFTLTAGAVIYLVYGVEGAVMSRSNQDSDRGDLSRIGLSFSLSAYSIMILYYIIMPFSMEFNHIFLPIAFSWGTLNTLL